MDLKKYLLFLRPMGCLQLKKKHSDPKDKVMHTGPPSGTRLYVSHCPSFSCRQHIFYPSFFQARDRGLDVYGRFGYTLHTGNTPDPMKTILREINDEERTNSIGRAGSQVSTKCAIADSDCTNAHVR